MRRPSVRNRCASAAAPPARSRATRHRGRGLGQELLRTLARVCVERGYHRLEWWVLDWNAPSIGFYESIGARAEDEWTRFRLAGDALVAQAAADRLGSGPGGQNPA